MVNRDGKILSAFELFLESEEVEMLFHLLSEGSLDIKREAANDLLVLVEKEKIIPERVIDFLVDNWDQRDDVGVQKCLLRILYEIVVTAQEKERYDIVDKVKRASDVFLGVVKDFSVPSGLRRDAFELLILLGEQCTEVAFQLLTREDDDGVTDLAVEEIVRYAEKKSIDAKSKLYRILQEARGRASVYDRILLVLQSIRSPDEYFPPLEVQLPQGFRDYRHLFYQMSEMCGKEDELLCESYFKDYEKCLAQYEGCVKKHLDGLCAYCEGPNGPPAAPDLCSNRCGRSLYSLAKKELESVLEEVGEEITEHPSAILLYLQYEYKKQLYILAHRKLVEDPPIQDAEPVQWWVNYVGILDRLKMLPNRDASLEPKLWEMFGLLLHLDHKEASEAIRNGMEAAKWHIMGVNEKHHDRNRDIFWRIINKARVMPKYKAPRCFFEDVVRRKKDTRFPYAKRIKQALEELEQFSLGKTEKKFDFLR